MSSVCYRIKNVDMQPRVKEEVNVLMGMYYLEKAFRRGCYGHGAGFGEDISFGMNNQYINFCSNGRNITVTAISLKEYHDVESDFKGYEPLNEKNIKYIQDKLCNENVELKPVKCKD
jgi:hypothetical protein